MTVFLCTGRQINNIQVSIEQEYVAVSNMTDKDQSLRGWVLSKKGEDDDTLDYKFPAKTTIGPGQTVKVMYWGVQPHFCPWKNVCFPIFSNGEKWGNKYMEREGNEYFPFLSHFSPWGKMGLDPPIHFSCFSCRLRIDTLTLCAMNPVRQFLPFRPHSIIN